MLTYSLRTQRFLLLSLVTALGGSCSSGGDDDTGTGEEEIIGGSDSTEVPPGGFISPEGTTSGPAGPGTGPVVPVGSSGTPGEACVSEQAGAQLQPIILGFAFDVSGSMGKGDLPYHDRSRKWDPVVTATKGFFADENSAGLSATLTFFPTGNDDICDSANYENADVALTDLPSPAFAAAIDEVTPETEDDWRGGTPTLAVLEGTWDLLQASLEEHPLSTHAIVLVTDGYPQGCDDADDIEGVADFVGGFADQVKTYVIGVANPVTDEEPNPPDVVTNLNLIAASGGTGQAFLIDTLDPAQTATSLAAALAEIRGSNLSCTLEIPAPPSGQTLDTGLVNVTYNGTAGAVPLIYSPDCSLPDSWYYDNPQAPSSIQLCEATCTTVLADVAAQLNVEFGCVPRTTVPGAR